MLFLVTKKENIKCTNCPISTHPAEKVTCACYTCLCFSYCLCFKISCKIFLFLSRAVSENAILPSQEHLILLAKQSGQHGMILVIFQRLIKVPALLFTLQFMRLLLFIERIGGKLLYVVLRPFFPNLILLILSMHPKILYM